MADLARTMEYGRQLISWKSAQKFYDALFLGCLIQSHHQSKTKDPAC